jgi:hypothetical protein
MKLRLPAICCAAATLAATPLPVLAQDAAAPATAIAPTVAPLTKEIAVARASRGRHGRIPGNIPAVDFDEGGEGVAYHNIGPIHDPDAKVGVRADGLAYRKADVEIEIGWGTTQVAAIKAGEWMTYSVEVANDGIYDLEAVVSGFKVGEEAGAFRIEFDGEDKTGEIVAPNTGKWYVFKTVTRKGLALKKGWHTMRVVFTRGEHAMNLADLRFVPAELPFIK